MIDSTAAVVLHLRIKTRAKDRARLRAFCRRAFPVYESVGGTRMELYEDLFAPGSFDEVGYYRALRDYRRSERAIRVDPAQRRLIAEWRALLLGPPEVSVFRRVGVRGAAAKSRGGA